MYIAVIFSKNPLSAKVIPEYGFFLLKHFVTGSEIVTEIDIEVDIVQTLTKWVMI